MTQKVQRMIVTPQLQFIDEIEYQVLNTDADFKLLSDSGETKDDICSPTFVKIDEHTDEGKEKLDTAGRDTLGELNKNHLTENDEFDATVQDAFDWLDKDQPTENNEFELEQKELR